MHREGHAAYYGELVWVLTALELGLDRTELWVVAALQLEQAAPEALAAAPGMTDPLRLAYARQSA